MDKYNEQFQYYLNAVNESLPSFLPSKNSPQGAVIDAMEYSLLGGGKRIRGIFVLAFYQLFGGININIALPFAAAMEMVHAYSLIHDDLPCMDNDDMRRGKPSCHIKYGEATALLAGDGLLTLAFDAMTKEENLKHFSAKQILDSVKKLAYYSGTQGMIGGQVMDLANEGQAIDLQRLEETDYKKTGGLFIASAVIGSILAGAGAEDIKLVEIFARNIGIVFQMVDDVLDVTSSDKELGKPVNSDSENQKQTYTTLFGVEKTMEMAERLTLDALDALTATTAREISFLETLVKELINRNK